MSLHISQGAGAPASFHAGAPPGVHMELSPGAAAGIGPAGLQITVPPESANSPLGAGTFGVYVKVFRHNLAASNHSKVLSFRFCSVFSMDKLTRALKMLP